MNNSKMWGYRRNLPHVRVAGATYFVTWRLHPSQAEVSPDERTWVVQAIRHFDGVRYDLLAFVVMNDHVHAVFQPRDEHLVEAILHSWKSFTAHRLARAGGRGAPIWQAETFDRVVRDDAELEQKILYVLGNPTKRWPEIESYPWVGGSFVVPPQ